MYIPKLFFALACIISPQQEIHPKAETGLKSEMETVAELLQINKYWDQYNFDSRIECYRFEHKTLNVESKAPSLETLDMIFYGREKEMQDGYAIAREYRDNLGAIAAQYGWRYPYLGERHWEMENHTNLYYKLWSAADTKDTSLSYRRQAALYLIDQIGANNFYAGRFPPPVPHEFLPWRK